MNRSRLFALLIAFTGAFAGLPSLASATTYVEDFEAPFPAWETGWLGTQSDVQNYYGVGGDRGNNPDGLWLSKDQITFLPSFADSITDLSIDIANFVTFDFVVLDTLGNELLHEFVPTNSGAFSDPGTYWHFAVSSANGIAALQFVGAAVPGNTSIDNVVVQTSAVPVPAAVYLFGSALRGVGFLRRRMAA